jgi:hypothetical protein
MPGSATLVMFPLLCLERDEMGELEVYQRRGVQWNGQHARIVHKEYSRLAGSSTGS